jgi:hypothetical protein
VVIRKSGTNCGRLVDAGSVGAVGEVGVPAVEVADRLRPPPGPAEASWGSGAASSARGCPVPTAATTPRCTCLIPMSIWLVWVQCLPAPLVA